MRRDSRIITVIVLLVIVVGLGIGFAAFSSTLNISSSAAVNPNSADFKVIFSNYSNSACTTTQATTVTGSGTGAGTATVSGNTTLSGVTATFTAPGQSATYKVCAYNSGQYDAFLNAVTLGTPTCAPASGTTASLVTEACKSIRVTVQPGSTTYTSTNNSISSHKLAKGGTEVITVTVEYLSTGARADGNFTVSFSDTILKYETAD